MSIERVRAFGEPHFVYDFNIILPPLAGAEDVAKRATGLTAPYIEINSEGAVKANSKWYYALDSDIGPITIRYYDYVDDKVIHYHKEWYKLIIDPSGVHKLPKDYKFDITVQYLMKSGEVFREHKYEGYFPVKIIPPDYDMSTSDISIITVEYSGDDIAW